MRFNTKKCKVLSINHFNKNLLSELPFFLFPYRINTTLLDYSNEEKDLGIIVTNKFSFTNHHNEILSKATKQFNLLRRTCHFVNNTQKRRTLYLTLVRGLFEHGSQIWSPVGTSAIISFENFQKCCIKWIVHEQFIPYREADYLKKLTTLNILPIEYKFILSDLLLFHESIFELVPVIFPHEIVPSTTRTRSSTQLSSRYQVRGSINIKKKVLSNSFYIRAMSHWNRLPDECRKTEDHSTFKTKVLTYLWSLVGNRLNMANCNLDISDREPD